MALLATKGKAPGVYIQEITIPGPIAGAATSIAAFVGPAETGSLFTPVELTNITQFNTLFGGYIDDPYRVFVTHAVNGFFAEGGTDCYFVRVGTGAQAKLDLVDRSTAGKNTLLVTALKEGNPATATTVKVDDASLTSTTAQKQQATGAAATAQLPLAAPASTSADKLKITVSPAADAAKFSVGDLVHVEQGANKDDAVIADITADTITFKTALANSYTGGTITDNRRLTTTNAADAAKFFPGDLVHLELGTDKEDATVESISGATITFQSPLLKAYSAGTIRIADLSPGLKKIRVADTKKLEPGSYITISDSAASEDNVVKLVNTLNNVLTLTNGLTNTFKMGGGDPPVTVKSKEFKLTIVSKDGSGPTVTEPFDNLSMDPRHSRYFEKIVESGAVTVTLADPPSPTPPVKNLPKVNASATALSGGNDENLGNLTVADYQRGMDTLKKISEVRLLCLPDAVGPHFKVADTQAIQTAMISHCEKMQDRFAILDSSPFDPADPTFNAIQQQRQNLNSDGGYAALYFPWIGISNPAGSGKILVPPSGHTAGIFANNDSFFGVYKAPANERVTKALSVEVLLTDDEQGPLNDLGINVIRTFPFQGVKIWGARTIAPPDVTAWRFVNVRRLLLFIEKSIQDGTRFAVFEPNNLALWQRVKRMVTDFLMDEWKEGALFGNTPDKAFRVRVDETNNPPEIRAQGILVVEVTVVPTTPAEFIIFQVVQDITGSTLREA